MYLKVFEDLTELELVLLHDALHDKWSALNKLIVAGKESVSLNVSYPEQRNAVDHMIAMWANESNHRYFERIKNNDV